MDEKQKQFIDIRKKSIRDKNSREYQDLSSEDPFSIGWIRNEYQYVKRALPKKSYIIPYNEVVLRRLDGTLSSKGMHDKVKKALEDDGTDHRRHHQAFLTQCCEASAEEQHQSPPPV